MARILIIDDEEFVLYTLRVALEAAGHVVVQASNGTDGISIREALHCDVIVTDIIMPDKDGVQTITELKELFPDQKIMAITGGGRIRSEGRLEFARKVGATTVLTKPFSDDELLAGVNACLAA